MATDNTHIIHKNENPSVPTWGRIILIIISLIFVLAPFHYIGLIILGIPITTQVNFDDFNIVQLLLMQFFYFLGLLLLIYVFRKHVDQKSFNSIGISFNNRIIDLFIGLIISLIILVIGFSVMYFLKYLQIRSINLNIKFLLLSFLFYVLVSLFEEFLVRGYILNNLLESMNKYLALVISSIIFSLFHFFNDNTSLLGMINLFLAGLTLGAAYIYTRNLWFPISLHLFWNFIQGPILGFNVSGVKLDTLIVINSKGSDIITGGDFGFEGSILCTILELICFIAIIYYFQRKETLQLIEVKVQQ